MPGFWSRRRNTPLLVEDPDQRQVSLQPAQEEQLGQDLAPNVPVIYNSAGRFPGETNGRLPYVEPEQLAGEELSNDPDWVPTSWCCYVSSYFKMHNLLVEKAKVINEEGRSERQRHQVAATGQEAPTVRASLQLLREQVFALCPMRFIYFGIFFSTLLTIVNFIVPYIMGKLVDVALDASARFKQGQDVDINAAIMPYLIQCAIFMSISYVSEVLVGILFAIAGHTTVTRLRVRLFRNLVEQEVAFYDAHVSGEISSRLINDAASLSALTQFTTQTLLGAIVKFTGSLVAMFWTHPMLAVVATIITPVNMLLVRRTGKTVGHYGVVQNWALSKANGVAVEVLGNIRTVQANVGEVSEANRFTLRVNYWLRVIKATVYIETVLRFTQFGLSKLRDLIVLGVAMHQVVTGQLTIGSYTAFAQYVSLYSDGFKSLSDIWLNFKQTITATGKFVQLLLREPQIPPRGGREMPDCKGFLTLENVSFAYSGNPDRMVLNSVNLEAVPGNIIALVGESGAGKTTLGRLLLRYYDPVGGRVLLDGQDLKELSVRWMRSHVGFVEQEPVLFDRPIRENIAYGTAEGKSLEEVMAAAKLSNAHAFVTALQEAYETHPGERAARISGGQKQRVAIARAVIRNPKVLLLDEATSALDSENEHEVQKALDELMVGKTTFIIAHRLSTVVRATKILVLEKGVVIESGSHEELVNNPESKYASFMRHQLVSPLLS